MGIVKAKDSVEGTLSFFICLGGFNFFAAFFL